jgi:beta-lactamase class A
LLVLALVGCTATGHHRAAPAPSSPKPSPSAPGTTASTAPAFAALERRYGARLGVYVLATTGSGRAVTYRADERFAFDSTVKAMAAGVLLRRDTDAQLAQVIPYQAADLQDYSPVTAKHVGTGMALRDLIAAAVEYSDNTAANLLFAQLGGPAGLQAALRSLGDATTHPDRTEPDLNAATPGDVRDTSTPRAFATDLRGFALGSWLTPDRRSLYNSWLVANTTGGPYIRSAVPAGWKVGDRTGNGSYGSRNDIAVAWPPSGGPVLIALMSDRPAADAASDDALLADATKVAVAALAKD